MLNNPEPAHRPDDTPQSIRPRSPSAENGVRGLFPWRQPASPPAVGPDSYRSPAARRSVITRCPGCRRIRRRAEESGPKPAPQQRSTDSRRIAGHRSARRLRDSQPAALQFATRRTLCCSQLQAVSPWSAGPAVDPPFRTPAELRHVPQLRRDTPPQLPARIGPTADRSDCDGPTVRHAP